MVDLPFQAQKRRSFILIDREKKVMDVYYTSEQKAWNVLFCTTFKSMVTLPILFDIYTMKRDAMNPKTKSNIFLIYLALSPPKGRGFEDLMLTISFFYCICK
jgi:hypothetical protein